MKREGQTSAFLRAGMNIARVTIKDAKRKGTSIEACGVSEVALCVSEEGSWLELSCVCKSTVKKKARQISHQKHMT